MSEKRPFTHAQQMLRATFKRGQEQRAAATRAPEPRFTENFEDSETTPQPTSADQVVPWSGQNQSANYSASSTIANPLYFGFWATAGVGFALLVFYILMNIGALGGWITVAVFIALGLDPAVRKFESWGLPRGAGVTAVILAFVGVVVAFFTLIIPVIGRQAVSFINSFPAAFEDFLNSDFFKNLDRQFSIRASVDNEVQDAFAHLTQNSSTVSGFFNGLVTAGTTLAELTTGTIVVLILSIYFLASLPIIKNWGVRLAPASKRHRVRDLTEKITHSVGQYVAGQALVAFLNATYALIVMLIIGAPFPLLLALFVLILTFIPLVGPISALVLVSTLCLLVSWKTALIFAICHLIYLQLEAYLISPRIMSKAVAVPGGLAIIAVAAGGALWGVLGALIAIPVAASLLILVREVFIPIQDKK